MAEYIEREALKEDLKESYERLRAIYDSLTYNEDKQICAGQLATFTEAILRVKEAPAADVVEVRHGRWEKQSGLYSCSECGMTCPYDVQADVIEYWACNYCPNCGAKIDKEEE